MNLCRVCFLILTAVLSACSGHDLDRQHAWRVFETNNVAVTSDNLTKLIESGNLRLVELFLTRNLDPKQLDSTGCAALHVAADESQVDMIDLLLGHGAIIDQKNVLGDTALMIAAGNGDWRTVTKLLVAGADVNARNEGGQTALMRAAFGPGREILQLRIAAQASEHVIGSEAPPTSAEIAIPTGRPGRFNQAKLDAILSGRASEDYARVVKVLLAHGANAQLKMYNGYDALNLARINNETNIIHLLETAGDISR